MKLHTTIKDACAHIRQYAKAERFPDDAPYYRRVGLSATSISMKEIVALLNELKRHGYSEAPALGDAG